MIFVFLKQILWLKQILASGQFSFFEKFPEGKMWAIDPIKPRSLATQCWLKDYCNRNKMYWLCLLVARALLNVFLAFSSFSPSSMKNMILIHISQMREFEAVRVKKIAPRLHWELVAEWGFKSGSANGRTLTSAIWRFSDWNPFQAGTSYFCSIPTENDKGRQWQVSWANLRTLRII